jgi:hypothetical protein
MKSIKDLREQYELITEKENKEQRKLTTLVRAGLFDAKKLPILKRALDKGADKMTPAEKKILIDLLDSLMNQVISNEPVYMKVKRNVQSTNEEIVAEAVRTPTTISDVPSIVVLRRKAVRVYPGGRQVGLYYSQQLDKYVTIPFGEAGIAEETNLEENYRPRRRYRDDDRDPVDIDQDYTDMSARERKKATPLNVAKIALNRTGSPISAIGALLLHRHLQKKYKGNYSPEALKKTRKDARKTVNRALGRNPKGSITEHNIMRNHQLDEAAPLAAIPFIAGAIAKSTAGRAIGGAIASGAKKLVSKGAAASARQARRSKALERLQKARKKNKNAFRGKKKKGDKGNSGLGTGLGLGAGAGLGSLGGGAGASNQPNWKTPVTHSRTSDTNLVTKVGPKYSRGGADAPVDPATARRLQKQFYTRESTEITIDGNIFTINSNIAEKFVGVYNSLSETNQEKMLNMMLNEETQNKVLEFVRRY